MEMTCPKCQGPMRSYERNGVTVDQCNECRGVFLDRGELERLVEAENAFYAAPPPQQAPPQPAPQPRYDQPRYDQPSYGGHGYGGQGYGGYPRKKRKSFFDELFD